MSRLACPLCGQQVAATRQGMARHQRADGAPCLPDDRAAPAIGTPALGCGAVALSVLVAIVSGSWPVLWLGLLASVGLIVWRANLSTAARVAAADRQAVRAVAEGAATTGTGPPARDVEADAERLLEELRQRQQTPTGRAKLRERVGVEHTLAHIGHWQGDRARYWGLRKNLFDLRRCAVVHNLHVIVRLAEPAKAA